MLKVKNLTANFLFFLCCLLSLIVSALTSYNNGNWYINIASYTIPILIITIFLSAFFLVLLAKKFHVLFVIGLLLCLNKPITETFSLGYLSSEIAKRDECPLNVMTFNVSTFNRNRTEAFMDDDSIFRTEFFKYLKLVPDDLDILCLQEFHNDDSENQRVIDEIVRYTGAKYYFTTPIWESWNDGYFGIITFSKYPIIDRGTLFTGDNAFNRGIFTDVLYQQDTIRIINIHLHSMNIRWYPQDTLTSLSDKLRLIAHSLKEGSKFSKVQIDQVVNFISKSPYPIILCGDFNTFP
ncbi:MAG: endonuclease/exonuclease/phosphatase family protein, partial [Opitutaceae bacterium]|nr:endonuclease/exonuclease/phosphatase family protein [Cytophagales bacterium]